MFDDDEWQASIGTADKIGNIEAFLATLEIFSVFVYSTVELTNYCRLCSCNLTMLNP